MEEKMNEWMGMYHWWNYAGREESAISSTINPTLTDMKLNQSLRGDKPAEPAPLHGRTRLQTNKSGHLHCQNPVYSA